MKLKLTTLSPVSIGNGQKMNSFADYIYDAKQKKIHFINKHLIAEKLALDDKLMNSYVSGITTGMDNNRTRFELQNFLENVLKLQSSDYILYSINAHTETSKDLNCIIKNADRRPYLPGSSIKGAIKTAILYDWLIDEKNDWCKNYLRCLKNKEEKEQLEKNLTAEFDKIALSVSDSTFLSVTEVRVEETKRLKLKSGELEIPQTWETIPAGQSFEIEISSVRKNSTEYSWEEICDILNIYSNNMIYRERNILKNLMLRKDKDEYKALLKFSNDIFEETYKEDSETIYLRVGNGKGYFFNSVGLALYDTDISDDKSNFVTFLRDSGFGKRYVDGHMEEYDLHADEFPLTRVVEFADTKPMGWVKLELIK